MNFPLIAKGFLKLHAKPDFRVTEALSRTFGQSWKMSENGSPVYMPINDYERGFECSGFHFEISVLGGQT